MAETSNEGSKKTPSPDGGSETIGGRERIDGSAIAARASQSESGNTDNRMATIEQVRDHTPEKSTESELVKSVCEVLVAIPAYNEESTIGDVVQRAREHTDRVLVVDDGSDDETASRAATAGAVVIEHGRNRGYGASLKTAFETARRDNVAHLVVLDGDGQHDPADVPRLVEVQKRTDAHRVIGSRFLDGAESNAQLYRRLGLSIINTLTDLSMGVVRTASRVSDTQSGFRAPNFSVTPRTAWAIDVLETAGYRYDSSVFPVKTPMLLNAHGLPATMYFHPWEFNPTVETADAPVYKRFISFHGVQGLKAKLEALLDTFEFATASSVAREYTDHLDMGRHDATTALRIRGAQ